jgi:TolA-binding protein
MRVVAMALAAAVLAAGMLLCPAPSLHAETVEITADRQLGLARSLLAQGDYFRAITEFKRFLFLFPDSPEANTARFGVADALLSAGRLTEAEAAFKELHTIYPSGPEGCRATLGQALAQLRQGLRAQGRGLLEELIAACPEGPYAGRARIELALSLAEEGQWAKAQAALSRVSPSGPLLERRLAVLREGEAKAVSPVAAGVLSGVVPGAGQVYCGRPRDGALALLLNGLFIWATVEAGLRGNAGLAAGLGLVESAWYGGTIYGAVNCAYRHERADAERAREQMERLPEAGRGLVLAWGCAF